jgi:hypothetical protein
VDWWEVISDPTLYDTFSFLHIGGEDGGSVEGVFGNKGSTTKRSTEVLMDWESLFNSFEDHDLVESLFEDTSDFISFITSISSFTFSLPGNHQLRLCISAEVSLFSHFNP